MEREHFDLVWRFHANILGGSRIFTDLLVHQKRVRSLLNWSMGSRRSSPFSIISTGEEGTKRRRKKKKMERRREKTTSNELIIQMTRSLPVPCRGMWGENAHHLPPPTKIVIRVHAKTIRSEWIWKKWKYSNEQLFQRDEDCTEICVTLVTCVWRRLLRKEPALWRVCPSPVHFSWAAEAPEKQLTSTKQTRRQ